MRNSSHASPAPHFTLLGYAQLITCWTWSFATCTRGGVPTPIVASGGPRRPGRLMEHRNLPYAVPRAIPKAPFLVPRHPETPLTALDACDCLPYRLRVALVDSGTAYEHERVVMETLHGYPEPDRGQPLTEALQKLTVDAGASAPALLLTTGGLVPVPRFARAQIVDHARLCTWEAAAGSQSLTRQRDPSEPTHNSTDVTARDGLGRGTAES